MDLHTVELPGRAEAVVVDNLTVADIHSGDALQFFLRQFKIKDIQVFCHPFLMDRLGDGGEIPLEVPAEDDLGCGLAVPAGDLRQRLVVENILLSLGKGAPRLGNNPIVLHDPQGGVLLEKRVDLNLIDHGPDLLVHAQVYQPLRGEVAHPDGPDRALPVQPLHSPPGAVVVSEGLVNQVQVDVVQPQLLQGTVKGLERSIIPGVLHPQLGGDEPLIPGHPGTAERPANRRFIRCGGVKQAVSSFQGL